MQARHVPGRRKLAHAFVVAAEVGAAVAWLAVGAARAKIAEIALRGDAEAARVKAGGRVKRAGLRDAVFVKVGDERVEHGEVGLRDAVLHPACLFFCCVFFCVRLKSQICSAACRPPPCLKSVARTHAWRRPCARAKKTDKHHHNINLKDNKDNKNDEATAQRSPPPTRTRTHAHAHTARARTHSTHQEPVLLASALLCSVKTSCSGTSVYLAGAAVLLASSKVVLRMV